MRKGCRQLFGCLNSQVFECFSPGNEVALACGQSVSCCVPGLLSLIETETYLLKGFGKSNEFIIKIPRMFGNH